MQEQNGRGRFRVDHVITLQISLSKMSQVKSAVKADKNIHILYILHITKCSKISLTAMLALRFVHYHRHVYQKHAHVH